VWKFILAAFTASLIGCSDYNLTKVVNKAPEIDVTPLEHEFGALNADGESAEIEVTIANIGNEDLRLDSIYLSDEGPNFTIEDSYPSLLEPGEITQLTVSYDPSTYEVNEEYLVIVSNDSDEREIWIPLLGSGDAPVISVKPDDFDFGLTFIGCEEETEILISNEGNVDLEISGIDYYVTTPQDLYSDPESTNGSFPWTLAPGEGVVLEIDYLPIDMVDDDGYALIHSNDPIRPEVEATQTGYGDYEDIVTDLHEQGEITPADILFVVDNSGSMSANQAQLSNNFDIFINVFAASGVDYQIAFITTDDPSFVGDIITPLTPDPAAEAANQINSIGSHGSPHEKGFDMSYQATTGTGDAAPGSAFLREGARLVVIYISDEDDFSSTISLGTDMAAHLYSLKSSSHMAIAHAVAGDVPGGCSGNGGAVAGTEYYNVATGMGGTFLSICAEDWGTPMEELARDSLGLVEFDLSQQPIEDTIWVTIDGIISTDWNYDLVAQSIIFTVPPPEGSEISVTYAIWPECN
jgi:hypothetical protein